VQERAFALQWRMAWHGVPEKRSSPVCVGYVPDCSNSGKPPQRLLQFHKSVIFLLQVLLQFRHLLGDLAASFVPIPSLLAVGLLLDNPSAVITAQIPVREACDLHIHISGTALQAP